MEQETGVCIKFVTVRGDGAYVPLQATGELGLSRQYVLPFHQKRYGSDTNMAIRVATSALRRDVCCEE